jgi:hypothetical protein
VNHDAIQRVTLALQFRLQEALNAIDIPGRVFVGPLDDVDSSGAPLLLFLYRIVPNASLRNRERRVPTSEASGVNVYRNSLPLDLYFLVTVGTAQGASEENLLVALGLAMQSLQVDPELTGPGLDYETVRVTLEPLSTDDSSRIWALFPTANYRTSVAYLASPVWIDPPSPESTATPVTDDRLLAGIGGREVRA